ncbi:MAG TPA: ABC transporter substrate-binding protein [Trueperaceae bacterium]
MKRLVGFTLTLLAFVGALFSGGAMAEPEGALRVGVRTEADIWDPHVASDFSTVVQLRNVYEPLVDLTPDLRLEGVLAESWEVSEDALTYTFHLRPDVTFTDGTPFDAESAKFSLERLIELQRSGAYLSLQHVDTIEAIDPLTLRVTLGEPFAPFLRSLWLAWMVSPTAVEEHDEENGGRDWLEENSAGTGPYVLAERERGERIVLEANPDYWRGWEGPHFATIELLTVPEAATQRLMLERGDLDISLLYEPTYIDIYRDTDGIKVEGGPTLDQIFARIQVMGGSTEDVRVRQALNYLWDGQVFADLMDGMAAPSPGPLVPELLGGEAVPNPYSYDPEKALELLAEAGYPNGQGLQLRIWTHQPDPTKKVLAEAIQALLASAGVNAEIQTAEWPAIRKTVVDYSNTGDPALRKELMIFNIKTRYGDPRELFLFLYHSDSMHGQGNNYMNYSNPEVDRLIDEAMVSANEEEAIELMRQAAEIVVRDAPDIFAGRMQAFVPMREDVAGYVHRPMTAELIHFYELHRAP